MLSTESPGKGARCHLEADVGGQRVAGPSRSGTGARRSRYFFELSATLSSVSFGGILASHRITGQGCPVPP